MIDVFIRSSTRLVLGPTSCQIARHFPFDPLAYQSEGKKTYPSPSSNAFPSPPELAIQPARNLGNDRKWHNLTTSEILARYRLALTPPAPARSSHRAKITTLSSFRLLLGC